MELSFFPLFIIHRPDEISATEISPRWNGIKRFHWAGWASGRSGKTQCPAMVVWDVHAENSSLHIDSWIFESQNVEQGILDVEVEEGYWLFRLGGSATRDRGSGIGY